MSNRDEGGKNSGEFFSDPIAEIIRKSKAELSPEVEKAIQSYAMGNPGAAIVLAQRAAGLKTFEDVERLVGWPLSEHSFNRTQEIWDKLR